MLSLGCPDRHDDDTSPRSYQWTIDTIAFPDSPQNYLKQLWGSSNTDVYIVGHNSNLSGTMYHFDGNSWNPVLLHKAIGGNIDGSVTIEGIDGSSSTDIWAVCTRTNTISFDPPVVNREGVIINYDGNDWLEVETPPGHPLLTISGDGAENYWTGGLYGTLFNYNGSLWVSDTVPEPWVYDTSLTIVPQFHDIVVNRAGEAYAILLDSQGNELLFYFDGNDWSLLDTYYTESHWVLWLSPSNTLYSGGDLGGVSVLNDFEWESFLECTCIIWDIYGTSDENIFAVGTLYEEDRGVIYHFNGSDWYEYSELGILPENIVNVWANEEGVFVAGWSNFDEYPQKTYIYHGY